MYLLIEHNGTADHLKIAEKIKYYAEDTYGATCEDSVSYDNQISLYGDNLEKVASFTNDPSDTELQFYCGLIYNEEDE
tara:strand:+ start:572 stop:805 length:234 start_codon:yes stop_codon:yes gene_type:complete